MTDRSGDLGTDSRQRILEAALDLASERGYEGATIGLVSERSGLPTSSIYWHFRNKDDLVAEAMEHGFRQWLDRLPALPDVTDERVLEDVIIDRCRTGARVVAAGPQFWRLGLTLSLQTWPQEPAARARFAHMRRHFVDGLALWWAGVLPPEAVEVGLPQRIGRLYVSLLEGLFLAGQATPEVDVEELAARLGAGLAEHVRRQWAGLQ